MQWLIAALLLRARGLLHAEAEPASQGLPSLAGAPLRTGPD